MTDQSIPAFALRQQLPARFGRFVLHERIGSGGMGVIYRASIGGIEGFRKTVAVKCILPHLTEQSGSFVEDLIAEAKLSVLMDHPNIIQVYELGRVDQEVFISMEYVAGRSLDRILLDAISNRQHLPVPVAATIALQLSRGLHYAHELRGADGSPLGVVHRDVSPSNVLVASTGLVKIIDFGIAKAANTLSLTQPGTVKGKLGYLAPEALGNSGTDRRVDVFATGVLLYELLALKRLFGSDAGSIPLGAPADERVENLASTRSDIPPELAKVLKKALAHDRRQRFQTSAELADRLVQVVPPLENEKLARALKIAHLRIDTTEIEIESLEAPAGQASSASVKSRAKAWLIGIALVVGLGAAAAFFALTFGEREPLRVALPEEKPVEKSESSEVTLPALDVSRSLDEKSPRRRRNIKKPRKPPQKQEVAKQAKASPPQPVKKAPPPPAGSADQPLDAAEIEAALRQHMGKFQSCIRDHFDAEKQRQGTLFVGLRIMGDGSIQSASVRPEVYAGTPLAACLMGIARGLKFRAHPDAFVEIEFPFEVRVRD